MKTVFTVFIVAMFTLATVPAEAGYLTLSFSPGTVEVYTQLPPFSQFAVYFVVHDVAEIAGFAMRVDWSPELTFFGRWVTNGPILGLLGHNYLIGYGSCFAVPTGGYQIVRYDMGYFAGPEVPTDMAVCARPLDHSDPSIPGSVAYMSCTPEEFVQLAYGNSGCDGASTGCVVINPESLCVVGNEHLSWSALKGRFLEPR